MPPKKIRQRPRHTTGTTRTQGVNDGQTPSRLDPSTLLTGRTDEFDALSNEIHRMYGEDVTRMNVPILTLVNEILGRIPLLSLHLSAVRVYQRSAALVIERMKVFEPFLKDLKEREERKSDHPTTSSTASTSSSVSPATDSESSSLTRALISMTDAVATTIDIFNQLCSPEDQFVEFAIVMLESAGFTFRMILDNLRSIASKLQLDDVAQQSSWSREMQLKAEKEDARNIQQMSPEIEQMISRLPISSSEKGMKLLMWQQVQQNNSQRPASLNGLDLNSLPVLPTSLGTSISGISSTRCSEGSCGRESASLRCSRCHIAVYCGKACQTKDWKKHKTNCIKPQSTALKPQSTALKPQSAALKPHISPIHLTSGSTMEEMLKSAQLNYIKNQVSNPSSISSDIFSQMASSKFIPRPGSKEFNDHSAPLAGILQENSTILLKVCKLVDFLVKVANSLPSSQSEIKPHCYQLTSSLMLDVIHLFVQPLLLLQKHIYCLFHAHELSGSDLEYNMMTLVTGHGSLNDLNTIVIPGLQQLFVVIYVVVLSYFGFSGENWLQQLVYFGGMPSAFEDVIKVSLSCVKSIFGTLVPLEVQSFKREIITISMKYYSSSVSDHQYLSSIASTIESKLLSASSTKLGGDREISVASILVSAFRANLAELTRQTIVEQMMREQNPSLSKTMQNIHSIVNNMDNTIGSQVTDSSASAVESSALSSLPPEPQTVVPVSHQTTTTSTRDPSSSSIDLQFAAIRIRILPKKMVHHCCHMCGHLKSPESFTTSQLKKHAFAICKECQVVQEKVKEFLETNFNTTPGNAVQDINQNGQIYDRTPVLFSSNILPYVFTESSRTGNVMFLSEGNETFVTQQTLDGYLKNGMNSFMTSRMSKFNHSAAILIQQVTFSDAMKITQIWGMVFQQLVNLIGIEFATTISTLGAGFNQLLQWYEGFPWSILYNHDSSPSPFSLIFAQNASMHLLILNELYLHGWMMKPQIETEKDKSKTVKETSVTMTSNSSTITAIPSITTRTVSVPASISDSPPTIISPPSQPRVLFVTGLPRSGTTYLQCLLALDPMARTPLNYEFKYPTCHLSLEERISKSIRDYYDERDESFVRDREIHPLHPAEDSVLFQRFGMPASQLASLLFASNVEWKRGCELWDSWFTHQDHTRWFEMHRLCLNLLENSREIRPSESSFNSAVDSSSNIPGSASCDHHWVCKDPSHVGSLDDIFRVYPDAKVVCIHRDIGQVLRSQSEAHGVDPLAIIDSFGYFATQYALAAKGEELHQMELKAAATNGSSSATASESTPRPRPSPRLLDVYMEDALADPVEFARSIYSSFGWSFTSTHATRIRAWVSDHPPPPTATNRPKLNMMNEPQLMNQVLIKFRTYIQRVPRVLRYHVQYSSDACLVRDKKPDE